VVSVFSGCASGHQFSTQHCCFGLQVKMTLLMGRLLCTFLESFKNQARVYILGYDWIQVRILGHMTRTICQTRGDEPICYRGPLRQLPLSKRDAQLFSHTMKAVKNEKNCSSTETNKSNKNPCEPYRMKFFASHMKFFCGPHVRHLCAKPSISSLSLD